MSPAHASLIYLGLPFLAGFAVPFFRGRPLFQYSLWIAASAFTISLTFLWVSGAGGRADMIDPLTVTAAIAFWAIAGLVGVLVGREAAAVRRDAKNTIEKRKASEIFR
ncbi:hypothetical protein HY29_06900 [Hyphomonas beringensis]|uniref:Uncharacterized protein n=1 Tax=Hyphomonas beringensis TaxID=1280946 RepID=A0A062U1G7_9PROT|nr:hypothetical protein [Hyphomonas beringensis]KCZ50484.1 hypothetical protein HY29_06900 [Hyphomonas beringensis]